MSRIGKKTIRIPAGVEIKVEGRKVAVTGPKGQMEKEFPEILDIKVSEGLAYVSLKDSMALTRQASQTWGLGRAMLANMIKGTSDGFQTDLEFNGIGFKAQVKGDSLELSLGYTNPVIIKAPEGVVFQVEKNAIKVIGMDKEAVGQTAALIRDAKPPEPYKGTGIKYKDEVIRRKAGKKAVATAG